jgi:hypothetical protein
MQQNMLIFTQLVIDIMAYFMSAFVVVVVVNWLVSLFRSN